MSIGPLGLNGLNKAPIPTSSKFSTPTISPLNSRLPSMDARLVAARLPGLAMYGSPYASPNFPGYLPYAPAAAAVAAATDPSSFYPAMGPGENADAWRVGLSQTAAAYFDPAMAAHYGYGYGPIGLSDGARRKNATRETTSTLKNWLNEHRKNPYPTKGEKIMLAIITKMTLTQVSTWFANARRRLKKENKMTWSPRNRCGEDDEDDDDLADDGQHNNEHSNSRTSSPITPASMPTNGLTGHSSRQLQFNGHHSGAESISDEGMSYNDALRLPLKADRDASEKSEEKTSSSSVIRQSSLDETRSRIPSSHLARHAAHPYQSSRSSPSFGAFPTSITPSMQSSITRPVMPFPTQIPHIPGASHPSMVHPGVAGQFNHAAAASLLAASRGHALPPHLLAALSEQMHYQQALQTLPMNSFLNSPEISKSSSNLTVGNSSPSSNREPSPAIVSKASSTAASPTKPKIWSLADVATNGDAPKSLSKEKSSETSQAKDRRSQSSPKDVHEENLIDVDFHQKLAIAMSRHYNLPNGLTQQQIHQLVSGIDANSHHSLISQNRFPPQLSGFGGIAVAEEKAKVKELEKIAQLSNETEEMLERASSTSESLEASEKALDKSKINKLATSPSHQRDSSMEQTP